MSACIFSAETGGEQGSPRRWKSDRKPLYRAPVAVRRAPCRRSRLRSVESLPRYVFQNVGKGRHCCKQRVRRSKKPEFPVLCVLRDSRFAASSVAAHLCLPGAGRDPYVPWASAFAGVTGFMMSALIPFTQGGSATGGEELRMTGAYAINGCPHAEERLWRVSKHAQQHCINFFGQILKRIDEQP